MQLTSLSKQPHQPCLLLKLSSVSILLDCGVDLSSLATFLPWTILESMRFIKLPPTNPLASIQCLTQCGERVYVDGPFEVNPVQTHLASMESVDVILISNHMSLMALPFFTESTGFRGTVYATEPTVYIGRLIIEELLEYLECVDREPISNSWKQPFISEAFHNPPSSDPRTWRSFYTKSDMENSLAKIRTISFRETISVFGYASITAYSSGHSIGSCNWALRTDEYKICYISASSSRTSHTKAVHWDQLRNSDAIILTSICRFPEYGPEPSVCNMFSAIVSTLKRHGSVILPMCPSGVVYDILDVLSVHLDQHDIPASVNLYLISPVIRRSLAYSNICAEWLSEKKEALVYLPEEPFSHAELMKNGRVRVFDSISGDFSRQMRTPCVVFVGHPSLRVGDVVHFLELWGNDARNAIILTDPDYPINEVYGPYENLAIRAFFHPVETRLDYTQINLCVLRELLPKLLVLDQDYTRSNASKASDRPEYAIMHQPQLSYKFGQTLNLPFSQTVSKFVLDSEVFRNLKWENFEGSTLRIAASRGYLSAQDNVLTLQPESSYTGADSGKVRAIRQFCVGKLDIALIIELLRKKSIKHTVWLLNGGAVISVDAEIPAEIHIDNDRHRTRIKCSSEELRQKLADLVTDCLKKIG